MPGGPQALRLEEENLVEMGAARPGGLSGGSVQGLNLALFSTLPCSANTFFSLNFLYKSCAFFFC